MPSLESTLAFFIASLLLGYAPGPDNLFVLTQAVSQGRRAGMLVVLGLCTGLLGHTAAVTLGLAAVFATSAVAFTVLKFVGAGYLLYLAWKAWGAPVDTSVGADNGSANSARKLYARGIVMNLTNPKVALFFLAFLPQFVDPKRGPVALQLCWFGLVFIVATLVAFGSITWLAAFFSRRLRESERAQRLLNRSAATVFAGLAVHLLTSRR